MNARVPVAEIARLLRTERVADLQARIQSGDFDLARYAATPRRRAEILAAVISKALSRGQLRRRLRQMEVSPEFCGGELLAISVEGGGLDVRRADGRGQVLTGPGVDARLLEVFPELLPFTLTNLTLTAGPGASADNAVDIWNPGDPDPANMGAPGVEAWNLTLFLTTYNATAAKSIINFGRTSFHPFGGDKITSATATSTYYNASLGSFIVLQPWNGGHHYIPGQAFFGGPSGVVWPSEGLNWVNTHATQADAVVGATSWTAVYDANVSQAFLGLVFQNLVITYSIAPCSTCTLSLQVNSACDGELVDGGVFALSNGMSCTQVAGTCTISGIPHGSYAWTWTKPDWVSQDGNFECLCAGGASTLFLSVAPEGGCGGPCTITGDVTNFCDGEDLSGVSVSVDGVVQAVTDESGVYTISGITSGSHEICYSKSGFATVCEAFVCEG